MARPDRGRTSTHPARDGAGGIPIEGFWDSDWRCTSAFGVRRNGRTYLVTAEHCFDNGDWVYDRNDDFPGSVSFEANLVDSAAIDTSAGATMYINDGATRVYQRANLSWNGQFVCESGFTSVCAGDSGGPVWATANDGVFESRGIVSGGFTERSQNPRCFESILWTETPAVLNVWGASLITG